MPIRTMLPLLTGVALLAIPFTLTAPSAVAVESSSYAGWTTSTPTAARSATLDLPASGFPSGALTITAPATGGTVSSNAGTSRPLRASSPFGARYGAGAAEPYLSTALGHTSPLTTVLTFAAPAPATGWGFNLGDIDAESVQIVPLDAAGNDLPPSVLGYQGSFDYDASDDAANGADLPTWTPGTGVLSGHGTTSPANPLNDTKGASGWFEPTQPISGLRFRSTNLTLGSPSWQLWIAARTAAVTGTVQTSAGALLPNVTVELETPAGDPLPETPAAPAEVTTDQNGSYEFPAAVRQPIVVVVIPPAGDTAVGVTRRPVDLAAGDASVEPFVLRVAPISRPSTPPKSSPETRPSSSAASTASGIRLANTGSPAGDLSVVAVLALISGGLVLVGARRPRGRHS